MSYVALCPMLSDTQYHKNVIHGRLENEYTSDDSWSTTSKPHLLSVNLKIALCKKRMAYIQMVALFILRH